jgi:hypothetical protein
VAPRQARARHHWLRATLVAIAGAVTLSACVELPPPPPPPPPPLPLTECTTSTATAADYNALFNKRSAEWAAADMTTPIGNLGNGQFAWLFGDTFAGRVNADGSLSNDAFFNNSLISETNSPTETCLTHRMPGSEGHRTELFPDPSSTSWFWPVSGYKDPSGAVHVVLLKTVDSTAPGGVFDFYVASTKIATVDIDDQHVTSSPVSGGGLPDAPQNARPAYGDGLATDSTYVYFYGFANPNNPAPGNYVARAPIATPEGPWEFWTGPTPNDWSSDVSDAVRMDFTLDSSYATYGPVGQIHPIRYGTGWLAVAKDRDFDGSKILLWKSPNPAGPWSLVGQIGSTPVPASPKLNYGARLVDLPGAGWTVAWNINDDFWAIFGNVRLYGPKFAAPSVSLPDPNTFDGT